MYSTCLHCTKSLNTNQVLETLPIGRRVAFDAAKGRLWVVCRACARWNLVPFDTRLESIDACERLYRGTPTRYATDNIGLARTKEGLELVRIGQPLRPEFASWRYGDSFGRRRRRNLAIGAGATMAGVAAWGGLIWLGGIAFGGSILSLGPIAFSTWSMRRRSIPVPSDDGVPRFIAPGFASVVRVEPDAQAGWAIRGTAFSRGVVDFESEGTPFRLTGIQAERVLLRFMPRVNGVDGRSRDISLALTLMAARQDFPRLLTKGPREDRESVFAREIAAQPSSWRLAVEMALHEHREREALEGELKLLEREWREAEQLGKIADDLLLTREE